jgi:hypothetical protein
MDEGRTDTTWTRARLDSTWTNLDMDSELTPTRHGLDSILHGLDLTRHGLDSDSTCTRLCLESRRVRVRSSPC